MSPPRPASPEFGHVRAILAAFGLWMATSVAGLAGLPGPARALSVRVTHALFLAGRELLVGLVVALVAAAALRVGLRGWRGYVLLGGLALGIAAVTLGDELGNFAGTLLPAAPGVAAAVARRYLTELFVRDPDIDTIVLGCTHYPLLRDVLARTAAALAGRPIAIVDSASAMAEASAAALGDAITDRRAHAGALACFATDISRLDELAPRFLGEAVTSFDLVDL